MGGPRAWKEMQQRQAEFRNRDFDEEQHPEPDSNDEDAPEQTEKRDHYAEYNYDPETENEKAQRLGNGDVGEDEGQEDVRITCIRVVVCDCADFQQEFTMTSMLKTLNINLQVIGFDRLAQRWAD